jgi:hypothetical protein
MGKIFIEEEESNTTNSLLFALSFIIKVCAEF